MNREEYKKEISAINDEIQALEQKKRDVATQYIQDNSDPTLLGKRVVVEYALSDGQKKISLAWLDSYDISPISSSKIIPILYRDRRDGTKSKNRFFVSNILKIEIADEDNIPKEPDPVMLEDTCDSPTCSYRGTGVCTYEVGQFCPAYVKKK